MQIIYKFRVCFEEHEDVVRFIDIESTSSFEVFHNIIQSSVGFDGSKDFSFYLSNDIWRVENKICGSGEMHDGHLKAPGQTLLNKFINDPHQRFIYVFDPDLEWSFYIELVKIQKGEPNKKYPLVARKEGEAPKQHKLKGKLPGATPSLNEYDKMAEMLMASRLMDDLNKPAADDDDDELDEDIDIEIDDIALPEDDKPIEIKKEIIPKAVVKPAVFDLKFDEEEFKVDDDDLSLFESEEGEDDPDKETDDDEFSDNDDFGGYGGGNDYDNDDY